MSDRPVRVRYAPSPTGSPHVGNIRTALFNWLYARHSGGKFIVRVEDTDQAREVENGLELILESLRWMGLDWDEGPDVGGPFGPYRQSERLPIYQEKARWLVANGYAYTCYCSEERLAQMRAEQMARKEPPGYDRKCRFLSPEERAAKEREGIVPVIRLAVPLSGQTSYNDLIHGTITFNNASVDDQVLLKSDGFPTYHLAVVVDDHLMQIDPIMRADEWVSSVPKHILLYNAFGWQPPTMIHVPMVLGQDRKKLSKRHGATSTLAFRDEGYLPEAMVNFLALLGWAYDDKREIFNREELIEYFTLEKLGHTPGIFDYDKLLWMNSYYLRQLTPAALTTRALPFITTAMGSEAVSLEKQEQLIHLMPLVQERAKTLKQVVDFVDFLFLKPEQLPYTPEMLIPKGMTVPDVRQVLQRALVTVQNTTPWDAPTLETGLRTDADALGLKPGPFFGILRVAITGKTISLPLFESMAVLGMAEASERIAHALHRLN